MSEKKKENAMHLSEFLTIQLMRDEYECCICVEVLQRTDAVTSCPTCFQLFHLKCARDWWKHHHNKTVPQLKCPLCSSSIEALPSGYTCFCGKFSPPTPSPNLIPHSCGYVCEKPLSLCGHPCEELCHPGPCPPCRVQIPSHACTCGRVRRENITCNAANAFTSCEQICGKPLSCGRHTCSKVCHKTEGTTCCSSCQELIAVSCFCHARQDILIPCSSLDPSDSSDHKTSCGQVCGKQLDCAQHQCEQICHPGMCESCPFDPARVTSCPCGKTKLDENARLSCSDPIPLCDRECSKVLTCGVHSCRRRCHAGSCGACDVMTETNCWCNSIRMYVTCDQKHTAPDTIRCFSVCKALKSCQKHMCQEICCREHAKTNEKDTNKKVIPCNTPCRRKLACSHLCPETCHIGRPCPPCVFFSTVEIYCACGKTMISPPVACNTPPPKCKALCAKSPPCGHILPAHTCHQGPCPPCTHRTSKMCAGEHDLLHSIPCFISVVTCRKSCGKVLPCGHLCQNVCHSGPCSTEPLCSATCSRLYTNCEHKCQARCHGTGACPSCNAKIEIQCPCGHQKMTAPCKAKENERPLLSCDQNCRHERALLALGDLAQSSAKKKIHADVYESDQFYYSLTLWDAAVEDFRSLQRCEQTLRDFAMQSNSWETFLPALSLSARKIFYELGAYYGIEVEKVGGGFSEKGVNLRRAYMTRCPPLLLSDAITQKRCNPHEFVKDMEEQNPQCSFSCPVSVATIIIPSCLTTLAFLGSYVMNRTHSSRVTFYFSTLQMKREALTCIQKKCPLSFDKLNLRDGKKLRLKNSKPSAGKKTEPVPRPNLHQSAHQNRFAALR